MPFLVSNGLITTVEGKVFFSDRVIVILYYFVVPGVRLYYGPHLKLFGLVGWGRGFFICCLAHRGSTGDSRLRQIFSGVVWQSRDLQLSRNTMYLSSPRL